MVEEDRWLAHHVCSQDLWGALCNHQRCASVSFGRCSRPRGSFWTKVMTGRYATLFMNQLFRGRHAPLLPGPRDPASCPFQCSEVGFPLLQGGFLPCLSAGHSTELFTAALGNRDIRGSGLASSCARVSVVFLGCLESTHIPQHIQQGCGGWGVYPVLQGSWAQALWGSGDSMWKGLQNRCAPVTSVGKKVQLSSASEVSWGQCLWGSWEGGPSDGRLWLLFTRAASTQKLLGSMPSEGLSLPIPWRDLLTAHMSIGDARSPVIRFPEVRGETESNLISLTHPFPTSH